MPAEKWPEMCTGIPVSNGETHEGGNRQRNLIDMYFENKEEMEECWWVLQEP